jgi:hypothetical protein
MFSTLHDVGHCDVISGSHKLGHALPSSSMPFQRTSYSKPVSFTLCSRMILSTGQLSLPCFSVKSESKPGGSGGQSEVYPPAI